MGCRCFQSQRLNLAPFLTGGCKSPELTGVPAHSPALQSRGDGFHPSRDPEQGWEQPRTWESVLGVKECHVGTLMNTVRWVMGR